MPVTITSNVSIFVTPITTTDFALSNTLKLYGFYRNSKSFVYANQLGIGDYWDLNHGAIDGLLCVLGLILMTYATNNIVWMVVTNGSTSRRPTNTGKFTPYYI